MVKQNLLKNKKKLLKTKILITGALPYINNELHLGHLYSTYLPADILKRTLKKKYKTAKFLTGVDIHGTKFFLFCLQNNFILEEKKEFFIEKHKDFFDFFDIKIDYFGRTDSAKHKKKVLGLFHKHKKIEKNVKTIFCKTHNLYLEDEIKLNNRCYICEQNKLLPNLELRNKLGYFIEFKQRTNFKIIGAKYNKEKKIPIKQINRNNLFGISLNKEQTIYVWYDAIVSYVSFSNAWQKYDKRIQFMGKDNVFFHTSFLENCYLDTFKYPDIIFSGHFLNSNKKKIF